jgi:YihY family inner membrane protein
MQFPPAWLRRQLDRLDAFQQRHRPLALVVAVAKRHGDDRGGNYASLITFYGLVSLFPLLLLFITAASRILGPNSTATQRLIHSALSQFPVIGTHLESNIHALATGSTLALIASALFLLWGALGITSALQGASNEAWSIPRHREPDLWVRTGRGLLLLGVIATSVVGGTVVASIAASGWLGGVSSLAAPGLVVVTFALNLGAYLVALKILAPKSRRYLDLLPGALLGAVAWSVLQHLGGYLLSHQLHRTSEIYGFFAIVLGLIFWLNLGARTFLYATEANVVVATHAWPRGLFEPSEAVKAAQAAELAQASEN